MTRRRPLRPRRHLAPTPCPRWRTYRAQAVRRGDAPPLPCASPSLAVGRRSVRKSHTRRGRSRVWQGLATVLEACEALGVTSVCPVVRVHQASAARARLKSVSRAASQRRWWRHRLVERRRQLQATMRQLEEGEQQGRQAAAEAKQSAKRAAAASKASAAVASSAEAAAAAAGGHAAQGRQGTPMMMNGEDGDAGGGGAGGQDSWCAPRRESRLCWRRMSVAAVYRRISVNRG